MCFALQIKIAECSIGLKRNIKNKIKKKKCIEPSVCFAYRSKSQNAVLFLSVCVCVCCCCFSFFFFVFVVVVDGGFVLFVCLFLFLFLLVLRQPPQRGSVTKEHFSTI